MVTKVEGFGILTKLSARGALEESLEDRERKKGLTKTAKRGSLIKLLRHAERTEKSQKLLKKVLDKRDEVLYNSNVPPRAACTL